MTDPNAQADGRMSSGPLTPDAATPAAAPDPQLAAATPQETRKNYFELRLRIRYGWLWTVLGLTIVVYPMALIYTAFSMQFYETHGPQAVYQKQWEDTGCPNILREQAKTDHFDDWIVKRRWKHLLLLDASYLAVNNQDILNDPLCLGAAVRLLTQTPGPWRYDIVDSKTQTIIVSVTQGK